ncbi:ABC transporter ATP-binding protein [Ktedonobacter sp. SOSP1-85]|uniref:ABC transporter ATP-binding protein n=1 Tax=Ktedonobacter sp. SOSP1-85 TaxID=2778367 RepID=UPI001F1D4BCD|nr:ABC transporter ATP-binding protein [Ktedonobacter sp. SOSP1-85]
MSVGAMNQLETKSTTSAAIELQNLEVKYGKRPAVNGLSLTVPAGAIFGFLGPNGAGKTTTIKTMLGLRKPDGGSVRVLGYDAVTQSLEVRGRVGYMSEVNSLYDFLTIPQHCAFCHSVSTQWDQGMVDHYVSLFGLPTNSKVGTFSKGMKSQLALSLLMGSNPDLLILDEPTAGLDPVARHQVLNRLVAEIAAQGKTIFFSSHILSEVEAVADWVGIIRDGKLIVCDELDHLKQTQKVLKLTYVELPPAAEVTALRDLPGVMSLEQEGRSVRLLTHGNVESLSQTIQARPHALRDVDIVDLDLEDLFLTYMKEERNGR